MSYQRVKIIFIPVILGRLPSPGWRGSAIGIYRFWRDLGYGIGALLLGLVAHLSGRLESGLWFVAMAMVLSGPVVKLWSKETRSHQNPEP